uniref:Uncharacterized protein n=1 Tax=viral metagenome TaxID=1070528 RepID=A0A6C0I7J7_9ZZZZ
MSKIAKSSSSSIVTKTLKSVLKSKSKYPDPESDEEGEHPEANKNATDVFYNDFDNSQETVTGSELEPLIDPPKDYRKIADLTKQQLMIAAEKSSEKSSGRYPTITWNPDVTVLEYTVDHGREFEPTNNEPPQDEKMEKLAQKVSDCLLKGIKYEPLDRKSQVAVTSAINQSFEKANEIQPGVKMTALRGEDMCEAYFTKNNLHLLDDWYYDYENKISYLDYAVELTVRKYIELNKGILYNIDYFIQWLLKKCKELMGPAKKDTFAEAFGVDSDSEGGSKKRSKRSKKRSKRSKKRSIKRSKRSKKRSKKRITKRR